MTDTILVTGGAGYFGAVLTRQLVAAGYQVRILDTLERGASGVLEISNDSTVDILRGNVCDPATVERAVDGVDTIVHLAALVGYPSCQRQPQSAILTNIEGTQNIARYAMSHQKIVFASTGSVYGTVRDGLCTEETPIKPLTLYGETKATAERHVAERGNAVIFRYATAFGFSPKMRLDILPNNLVYEAISRRSLLIYEPHARRTFIHVRDMGRAVLHAIHNWDSVRDQTFNVGDESLNLTKKELAEVISDHVKCHVVLADFDRDADRRDYEVSYAKIAATNYKTEANLREGIEELVRVCKLISEENSYRYH